MSGIDLAKQFPGAELVPETPQGRLRWAMRRGKPSLPLNAGLAGMGRKTSVAETDDENGDHSEPRCRLSAERPPFPGLVALRCNLRFPHTAQPEQEPRRLGRRQAALQQPTTFALRSTVQLRS